MVAMVAMASLARTKAHSHTTSGPVRVVCAPRCEARGPVTSTHTLPPRPSPPPHASRLTRSARRTRPPPARPRPTCARRGPCRTPPSPAAPAHGVRHRLLGGLVQVGVAEQEGDAQVLGREGHARLALEHGLHDLGPAPRVERLWRRRRRGRRPARRRRAWPPRWWRAPAASGHARRSAHAAAGTLGPKMAAVLCASGVLRAPRSGASPPRFDSPRHRTVTVRPVRRSAPRPAVEARKADAGVRTPCGGRCRRRSAPQGVRL